MSRVIRCFAALVVVLSAASTAPGQQAPSSIPRTASRGHRVDRIGRLEENPRDVTGDTPYQLSGSWGNARVLVRPSDDVDLAEYLGHRVALRGRQHRTQDGLAVLVADRVTPLEEQAAPVNSKVRQTALQDIVPVPQGAPYGGTPGGAAVQLPPGQVPFGAVPYGSPMMMPPGQYEMYGGEMPGGVGCPDCGRTHIAAPMMPGAVAAPCTAGCNSPESFWIRGEYLLWFYDGMRVPRLVTTGGNGVIGTTDLFGGGTINDDSWQSGFRIRGGSWWDQAKRFGVEGEYFWLSEATTDFTATSPGNPVLARPFFDIRPGQAQESAQLLAFPDQIRGTVWVDAATRLQSGGIWARINACCTSAAWGADTDGFRVDGLLGYRYMRLNDRLNILEDVTPLPPVGIQPDRLVIQDTFESMNTFHGIEVGALYELRRGRWMLELVGRTALGNNRQRVDIQGSSTITEAGVTETSPGGILASTSNIGTYLRDDFAAIPQLGATVGFQVTPRLRATAGYTFVYFSNVVRAGDQIDLDVNPDLFPPPVVPLVGAARPRFDFRETDFWAQGISLGAEFRF